MRLETKNNLVRYCGGVLFAALLLFCEACTGVAPLSDSAVVEQRDKKTSQSMLILTNSIGTHVGGTSGINVFLTDTASGLLHPSEQNPFGTVVTSLTSMIAATADAKYLYVPNHFPADAGLAGFAIDGRSGALKVIDGSPFFPGPVEGWDSWIAIDPSGQFLYQSQEDRHATITKYRIDVETGVLEWTNDSLAISGAGPMTFDPQGRFLFLANNITKTIGSYSVDPQSGTLKLNSAVPTGSYPGSPIVLGKFLYVLTKGGIYAYAIDEQGQLTMLRGSPFYAGESFTEIAPSPGGRYLFAIDGLSRGLSSFIVDSSSGQILKTADLSLSLSDSPFSLAVSPDGERLYVQICTNLQITPVKSKLLAYSVNQMTGSLTFESETETPHDSCAYNMLAIQR